VRRGVCRDLLTEITRALPPSAFWGRGRWQVDAAIVCGDFPWTEREIFFLNGARAEGFGKFGVSEIVFGDEDAPLVSLSTGAVPGREDRRMGERLAAT